MTYNKYIFSHSIIYFHTFPLLWGAMTYNIAAAWSFVDKPEVLEIIDEVIEKIKYILSKFYEVLESIKQWFNDIIDFFKNLWNLITGANDPDSIEDETEELAV
jgi:phage-related protein